MSINISNLWFPSPLNSLHILPSCLSRFQTQLLGCSCLSLARWPQWRSSLLAVNPSWSRRGTAGGYPRMWSTSSPLSLWPGPASTQDWGMTVVSVGRPSYLWPQYRPRWLLQWSLTAASCPAPFHLAGRPTRWWWMRTTGEAAVQRGQMGRCLISIQIHICFLDDYSKISNTKYCSDLFPYAY